MSPFAPRHTPSAPRDAAGRPAGWPLVLVLLVSAGYESLFLHHGFNHLDESWPLYAAMRLHAGGTLYDDVLWVFPPGHVWIAWIAYALEPPGFILARLGYAAFAVALVGAMYVLARRLMPEPFALLAGLLIAVAAPRGHVYHLLFGYRYLVFCVLALLALDRRLLGGSWRWMVAAGALAGLAFVFRQDPPFAVSCAVAVGLLATQPRRLIPDGALYGAGALAVVLPVIAVFASSVGLERLWREVVIHPFAMLQPLPAPDLVFPSEWDRRAIYRWFAAFNFRAIWGLYVGYAAALVWLWWRARRRAEAFPHGLLAAVVVFGGVFFVRSTGRSDEPHLDSAIPAVCLLVAHLLSVGFGALAPAGGRGRRIAAGALVAGTLASWVFLLGTDRAIRPDKLGVHPIQSLAGRTALNSRERATDIDRVVRTLIERTRPGDTILALSHTPSFYVLSGRLGPGYFDVVMPGTFIDAADEVAFVKRLEASPPAAVVWPLESFDRMPERDVTRVAPLLSRWVRARYVALPRQRQWAVLLPRPGSRWDPSREAEPRRRRRP